MISNSEYDYSNLNEKISGLMGALIGRGASEGDIEKLLKAETGQLAGRIGSVLGARTEAAAKRNATRDVAKQMTVMPGYSIFVDEDRQGHSANSDMEWLTTSPQTLTGINAEDNRRDLDGPAAMELFRRAQKNGSRGKAADCNRPARPSENCAREQNPRHQRRARLDDLEHFQSHGRIERIILPRG